MCLQVYFINHQSIEFPASNLNISCLLQNEADLYLHFFENSLIRFNLPAKYSNDHYGRIIVDLNRTNDE